MNRIYRSIWNQATGAYSAVSENVKSAGKRSMPGSAGGGAHFALKSMAAALMLGYGSLALAGPTGGTVVAGQANITGAPGSTVINQGSQNAVINWANFNINKGESVQFVQPNSNAVALNRVLGNDGTTILGSLSANGKVFIVNPNGILFGQGASVNTAGLVASTLDINNADFMAGNYKFSGNGTGKVLNQGSISAPGGYVALLGANVSNEGTINARLGSVVLAAGRAITLDVAGDGLLNVAVDQGAVGALVQNGGLIQAHGGSVLLTAQAAGDLLKTVVNNTGVIEAHTIDTKSGTIKLLGDMQSGTVNAGGTLDASAPDGGNGGFVDTSAATVNIGNALHVTTAAPQGLTGTWLIDPVDYTIAASGGNMTGQQVSDALKLNVLTIWSTNGSGSGAGDIHVNDTISWSANKLTLNAQNNINVNQPLRGSGTASLALEYGQANVALNNGAKYNVKAEIGLPSGLNFSTRLGSDGVATTYTVINSLGAASSISGTDLQGLKNALSGNFVLGANIDASGTANTAVWGANGFTPIGTSALPFTGQFDGLGHVITGLNSSTTTAGTAVGLFGSSSGSLRNIGLVAPVISANIASGAYANAAGLVGINTGSIRNAYVSGGTITAVNLTDVAGLTAINSGSINDSYNASTVISQGTTNYTGGLVGKATATSTIINSYNSGNVTSNKFYAGGLVSDNFGSIANSFNTGTVMANTDGGGLTNANRGVITGSFNTGAVTGNGYVGGIAARLVTDSQLNNSYSTGTVTGQGLNNLSNTSVATGGLVGHNQGQINNSYATGAVHGTSGTAGLSGIGGVVGKNGTSGVITNVYSSGSVGLISGGSGTLGGVIGIMTDSTSRIDNGYYNSTLNPTLIAVGETSAGIANSVAGLTSTQMRTASNFANFTFTTKAGVTGNNWVIVNTDGTLNGTGNTGATGPMLSSEHSTTIKSAHQLQLMAMDLAGNYTLGMDVNAAGTGTGSDVWNGGTFVPVGTSGTSRFTGTFDGAGHVISGLVVNRPGTDYAGLFGATSGTSVVRNLGLEGGSVTGRDSTGALIGSNFGRVEGSYSTASVTGGTQVGGLVGANGGGSTIFNSYASGAVTGTGIIGGLVGLNSGTLKNNYASGTVTGGSAPGGLVGSNTGSVSGNFWDTTTSGMATSGGGTGLTSAQMKQLSTYSVPGWDLASTWIVYDTYTYPLLRAFMTPLQVTFSANASKTYDATTTGWTPPGVTSSNSVVYAALQGILNYGAAGTAVNAGTYAITAGGLYSGQRGYAINSSAATLTINKRAATLTGGVVQDRAYDGTTTATIQGGIPSGLLTVDKGKVTAIGNFDTSNAGTGKTVTLVSGGTAGGNYTITASGAGLTGTITPKALSLSGMSATSRAYDGSLLASLTGGTLSGLVGSETLGLGTSTGVFADKNAGIRAVTVTVGALSNGSNGGLASNYTVTAPSNVTGTITPKALSWTNLAVDNKEYDGNATAAINKGSIIGLVSGETLTADPTAAFADKNAGNGKTVTVSTVLDNGSGGGLASNYTLADTAVMASITPKTLTLTGVTAGNKTYDGNKAAAITGGTLGGMIGSETVNLGALSGSFADQNAGTGKAVTVTGGTLSNGSNGGLASNYTVGSVTGLSANIAQKALTVTGVSVASKAYDGDTKATISGGTLNGLVGGESLTLSGQSGIFNDKNAANGIAVTVTGATLSNSSGLASNYTVSNATGVTGNITRKALTVGGVTAADKVYDGGLAAVLSGGTLSGMVGSETLGLSSLSGVFGDKNVASGKAVTVTGGALSDGTGGGLASNYTVAPVTGLSASITQKALTLSGLAVSAKAYDGNTKATLTGGTLDGLVTGETLSVSGQAGTFSDKNAGTGKVVTVTGTTLVDGSGLASNYSLANPTGVTGDITKKALTITGITASNRAYTGTTAASLGGTVILDGLVGAEGVGVGGMVGVFADKNVGTGKAVTITGAVMTVGSNGGLVSNYTISNPTGVTANITKATISAVTNIVIDSKVYDGGLNAIVNAAGATFGGIKSGDSLTVSATTATFADKNVGTGKTVNISGIGLGGTDAGNYNLTTTTGSSTGAITPKALTIIGMSAVSKVYDGNTKVTLSGGSISGLVGSEGLGVTGLSASFDDKNAGTGKTVTATGATLADGIGALASNYTVTNPTGFTASITPKALTVTGMTAGTRVYDGTTAATLSGGALSGLVSGETLVVSGGAGAYADKNVGTAKAVTVTGVGLLDGTGLASNYTVSNPTGVTGTITQKALTVTGALAADKTYDGALAATITGGTLSGMVGSETLNLGNLTGAFADKNAGAGKAVSITGGTLSDGTNGGLASNYSVGPVTGLSASIAQKALTVTGLVAANKVYDATTKASVTGGALNGLVGGETLGLSGLSGVFGDKNAGTGKTVTISGATLADDTGRASNYTVSNPTGVTANIAKSTITGVTGFAVDSKVYDATTTATVNNAGATFAGMFNGDVLSVSATSATFADKNAGSGKAVNASGLSLGGADAGNYNLTAATGTGTGTITQAQIASVTGITAAGKTYDGTDAATLNAGATFNGLLGSDSLSFSATKATFSDKNAATGKTVNVSGIALGGTDAGNYTLASNTATGTGDIAKATITGVSGFTAGSKVYDTTTTASVSNAGATFAGMVNGDVLSVGATSATFADKNAGSGKTVNASGLSLGGADAGNYNLTAATGTGTGTITQAQITGVTGIAAAGKTYDATTGATVNNAGATFAGMFNGDVLSVSATSATFADKNAGSGKAVNASGLSLGGADAGNYNLAAATGTGTGTITQAQIASVTGITAAGKTYDGTDAATLNASATFNGLLGSDSLSFSATKATFSDKNAATGKTVNVSGIALGGTDAGNYTLGSNTGTGTGDIAKANIGGVSNIVAGNKVYDATTKASVSNAGATFAGMVSGDNLSVSATSANFIDKNAGSGKEVNASGLSLGGTDAGNYNLTAATGTGTATITQAQITGVTGIAATGKTYDATTGATVNNAGATFAGMFNGDVLSVSATSATFADKNADSGKAVNASGLSLGGTDAGNYNLTAATGTGTATITQAQIASVTGITAAGKTYDGTDTATLNAGATFNGLLGSDSLSFSATKATFSDKNAATGKTVNVEGIVLGGTDAGNYTLASNTATGTGDIGKANIGGVSNIVAGNKVYDATTKASVSNAGATFAGMVNGDVLSVSATSATFADKNAGSGKAVNASGLSLGGTDAGNYNLTAATGTGTGTITQAQIASVTGITAAGKTYDGTDAATLNASATFNGLLGSDSLSFSATKAAFSDKNAGNGKTVHVEGIVLGGTDAGNYTLASNTANGTGTITPKALTVTGATAGNKAYDGTLAASVTGGALSGLVGGETLSLTGLTGTFATQNVASNIAVTASGATLLDGTGLASNYTVSNPTGLQANITPKELTIGGIAAGNKVYDGTLAASLTGGALQGLVGDETLVLSGTTGVFGDKNAGSNKTVTVSGASLADGTGLASNYTVSNPTGLTASITAKALTVTGQLAGNKVYDGNAQASLSGGALSGLVAGETLGFGGQTAVFSDKNAANGKTVTVTGTTLVDTATGLASNYTVSNPTGLTASITAKALTVTGQLAGNKVYDGNTVASLSGGTLSGLVAGETLGLAGQTAVFSDKNAANGKTVTVTGTTLVDTASGLASNYTVSNPTGLSASITQKALTVTGQLAGNKVYDGNNVASLTGGTLSGLVGGETLGFGGQSAVFSDKNAANGKAVTVTGTTLLDTSTGLASNYTVSNPSGLSASITQKVLTVTGQLAGNKVYDGNSVASLTGGTLSGLVGSETLGFGGQTAVFSDKNAANGKTVTVTGTTLVDTATGLASNYTVSNPTGLSASITQKALTVTGQLAGNKVYDGNAVASLTGGTLSGLVGSETLGIGGQSAVFSDKNAANGKAVTVTGTTLVDTANGLASNYTVSNPTGLTASITAKALTVTGQLASNKVYDGNTAAQLSGGTLSGLVAGETLAISGQSAAFADKNAGTAKTVTVTGTTLVDTAIGLASNYTVSNPTGLTASITPKALTVAGQLAGNKVYDGNTAAQLSGGVLAGLVAGESLGLAGQTASFADKNAASAKAVTVTGTTLVDTSTGLARNYTVSNPTGLTASITPASLLVRATGAASRVYDTTTNASVTLGDNRIAGDVLTISNSGASFADKNAGANKTVTVNGIALGGTDAGNYTVNATATTTASITQAALGVKVDNAEKDQGRANPAFTASYTGLLGNDTLANEVAGNLAFSTPATIGSPSGSYLVSAAGQTSTNYALTYTPGVLTVNPTEALQSAVASVIAAVNVAPSQGNMVQAELVAKGDTVTSKEDAVQVVEEGSLPQQGSTPVVQVTASVNSNVLPGLRLNVIDTGLRMPSEAGNAGNTSIESQ